MNKSIILGILSSISLILLFLISLNITLDKKEIIYQSCFDNKDCLFEFLLEKQDFNYCLKSTKQNLTQICLNQALVNYKDVNICNFLDSNESNSQCYQHLAIELNKIELCQKTQNHDNCIFQIAYKQKDISICNFSKDIDLCELSFALSINDKTICNHIKYKNQCLNSVSK